MAEQVNDPGNAEAGSSGAAGWWRAPDGKWFPPPANAAEAARVHTTTWQGADGNWYQPVAIGSTPTTGSSWYSPPGQLYGTPSYAQQTTSGLAITSFVLSLLFFFVITSILAIILGFVAHSKIRQSQNMIKGKGLATTGIVLGFLGVVLAIFAVAIPTFLGFRQTTTHIINPGGPANISAIQDTLITAQAYYARYQTYSTRTQRLDVAFQSYIPQISFQPGNGSSRTPNTIIVVQRSLPTPDANAVLLGSYTNGTCRYILDIESALPVGEQELGVSLPGVYYGHSSPTHNYCTAAGAPRRLYSTRHPDGWAQFSP
jgi:hypothetical protein